MRHCTVFPTMEVGYAATGLCYGFFLGIDTREVIQRLVSRQFPCGNVHQVLNPLVDGIHAGEGGIAPTESCLIYLNAYCTHTIIN